MISYKQSDPRWADKRMPPSNLTLKRVGCLVTAIADLSTYFGDYFDPAIVCDRSKFTNDARLYWSSVVYPSFKFTWRQYDRDEDMIHAALRDPNAAVVLEVNSGAHWVVAIGWSIWYNSFRIADPLYGDRATMRRYNDNITGAAYFKRT